MCGLDLSCEMIQCSVFSLSVHSLLLSSISQPAHLVYSGVVHKSDLAKMKHMKCSCCLKWRAIPLHVART